MTPGDSAIELSGVHQLSPEAAIRQDAFMTDDARHRLLEEIFALFDALMSAGDGGPDDVVNLLDTINGLNR